MDKPGRVTDSSTLIYNIYIAVKLVIEFLNELVNNLLIFVIANFVIEFKGKELE